MLFDADLSVERLIPALSIESGTRITPEDTLVIFDEVQEVPRAMTSLKMFNEAAPEYDVLATGSALGIAMHLGFSFPVGKVSRLKLYPMSFVEFLYACKQYALAEMLESKDSPLINVMHDRVMTWLRYFMYTGGMPEIVEAFASTLPNPDFTAVRKLQNSLVSDYRDDFSKHVDMRDSPAVTTLRLNQVWDSIPSQLAKENKKFVYGVVRAGGRGKDFESAYSGLSMRRWRCAHPPSRKRERSHFRSRGFRWFRLRGSAGWMRLRRLASRRTIRAKGKEIRYSCKAFWVIPRAWVDWHAVGEILAERCMPAHGNG